MISARMRHSESSAVVDMTHVCEGDYFIKIVDSSTIAHLVVEEVISDSRFLVRFVDEHGCRIGGSFPLTALELSKLHPNTPANLFSDQPRAVNG